VQKVNLYQQEAQMESRAGNGNNDNHDAVVSVDGDPEEHKEQTKLEAQDASDITSASRQLHREGSSQGYSQWGAAELQLTGQRGHPRWVEADLQSQSLLYSARAYRTVCEDQGPISTLFSY
jgi:hypothetical protein